MIWSTMSKSQLAVLREVREYYNSNSIECLVSNNSNYKLTLRRRLIIMLMETNYLIKNL